MTQFGRFAGGGSSSASGAYFSYVRGNALQNVSPTVAELTAANGGTAPAIQDGDRVSIRMSDGAVESWQRISGAWVRTDYAPAVVSIRVLDIVRPAPPTPLQLPTLAELGLPRFGEGDVIHVSLSNQNVERYVVTAGVPVHRETDIGTRRFVVAPPVANYLASTTLTSADGDIIELVGPEGGYFEAVTIDPGNVAWIMRSDAAPLAHELFTLAATDIANGYVTLSARPKKIVGVNDDTAGVAISIALTSYDSSTGRVAIPTLPVGTEVNVAYHSAGSSSMTVVVPVIYDVTRGNPTPNIAPTLAEVVAPKWNQSDTVYVHLSNDVTERWVYSGGSLTIRERVIGPRRYVTTPPIADFVAATNETTRTGDVVEVIGQGYFEAVNFSGTPIWIGRSASSLSHEVFTLSATDVSNGYVTLSARPTSILGVNNDTAGTPIAVSSTPYSAATGRVTIPALSVGTVISVAY